MKKLLVLLFLLLCFFSVRAQYPRATLWTSVINGFAAQDAVTGASKDVVLFVGSSTFTMWTGLQTDFPQSKVLNRAFGGSTMTDIIYYFNQVVAPYNPRQVVIYEGDNDLHETSKTPDGFMDDVITMTRLINIYFPNAEILLVSIKPSPSRSASFTKYQSANLLMKAYADKFDYINYVDTWTPMLKQDGSPDVSYFGTDMLHMNASGYALWKSILEPHLLTSDFEMPDKALFTESNHARYHDFSWVSVTSPSVFNTVQSGKISTDSLFFRNGKTSLKIDYQGVAGGNWMACVAGPDWLAYDITQYKEIEFWVYAPTAIPGNDLPYIYLESITGTASAKLQLSSYLSQIPTGIWIKVVVSIQDFKTASPTFTYDKVKTIFFSQLNTNNSPITFYVDDIVFKAESETTNPNASGDIFIDFGSNAAGFTSPGNWNNVHDHQAANLTLINDNGENTGIGLNITDPFYNGFNTNGPTSVSGDASIFAGTATSDNFFGHAVDWSTTPANPKAVFKLTGLDPTKYYSFSVFASRMGASDNREAKYSIDGRMGVVSASLNASDNSTKVANLLYLQPKENGELIFTTEAGENNNNATKFFYLGALRISKSEKPNNIKNIVNPSEIKVYYSNGSVHINEYTGLIHVFDINGKSIATGQAIFGIYPIALAKGFYIITTELGNCSLIVN